MYVICFPDGAIGSFLSYGAGGGSSESSGIPVSAGLGGAAVVSGHWGNGGHLFGGHFGGAILQTGHFALGFQNIANLIELSANQIVFSSFQKPASVISFLPPLGPVGFSNALINSFSNFSKVFRTPRIWRLVKKSFLVFFRSKSHYRIIDVTSIESDDLSEVKL